MTPHKKHPVTILIGPTASGKSSLALKIAAHVGGTIINADSMQSYKALPLLTAQPSSQDLAREPHRLYGFLSPYEFGSGALWREKALYEIDDVIKQGRHPILCGGSGLYLKLLTQGIVNLPDIPSDIRAQVRTLLDAEGPKVLYEELLSVDKNTAHQLHPTDSSRICRAIEVFRYTKKPLSYWQKEAHIPPPSHLTFTTIALIPPRDMLYERCNTRFLQMIEKGAIDEVEDFLALNVPTSSPLNKALGVCEITAFLNKNLPLEEAITRAQMKTRHYAKRQYTWICNAIKPNHTLTTLNNDYDLETLLAHLS